MTGMLACGAPVAPQRRNAESREATLSPPMVSLLSGKSPIVCPPRCAPPACWPALRGLSGSASSGAPPRTPQHLRRARLPQLQPAPCERPASGAARGCPRQSTRIARLSTAFCRVCCISEHCLSHSHAR